MEKKQVWQNLRKRLLNKYVIVLGVFAIVFLFVGEQSIINQIARKRQIRPMNQEWLRHTLQTLFVLW